MRFVTASEMQEIDRRAINEFKIPSLTLMENAGRACAEEISGLLHETGSQIAVFCGKGNNGGDGFVAARHLETCGFSPVVFFFQKSNEMKLDALTNFKSLLSLNIQLIDCSQSINLEQIKQAVKNSVFIVDALFGTGLSKPIEEPIRGVIELMNASHVPILAIDIPSGMNADTGEVTGVCVRAKITATLALPKKAFLVEESRHYTGNVVVVDIGIPRPLLEGK